MTKAIVLAAGLGSRLHPYTSSLPKGMVPFLGEALLVRQVQSLRSAGVGSIVVVGGAHADKLPGFVDSIIINKNYQTTNMVESLLCARDHFDGTEDIIISYSDIVCVPYVIEKLMAEKGDLVVSSDAEWARLWRVRMEDPLSDAESFKVSKEGYVVEIGKKVENCEEIQGQYIGLIKVSKSKQYDFIASYDQLKNCSELGSGSIAKMYMTDLLQGLIDQGWLVSPSFINGGWIEVDTVEDLRKYTDAFEKGDLHKLIKIDEVGGDLRDQQNIVPKLKRYINDKRLILEENGKISGNNTLKYLTDISSSYAFSVRQFDVLNRISRKIEIARKIYSRYDSFTWSPDNDARSFNHEELAFSISVFLWVFSITNEYRFLNTVLKGVDLLPDGEDKISLNEMVEYVLTVILEPQFVK